ncbi:hypothetical protein NPIL_242981 [Nephila pilipes]|uniref:Uncharacterized protein n=1 Tax=Nephila pilipes TaxID=299642 RepID=A0A8X6TU88_NEPPI|nr:hypothetical protein NPIL_242981 [Nephila pilipes]
MRPSVSGKGTLIKHRGSLLYGGKNDVELGKKGGWAYFEGSECPDGHSSFILEWITPRKIHEQTIKSETKKKKQENGGGEEEKE